MIEDCNEGKLNQKLFPSGTNRRRVLDLGCGPGFWTVEFALQGCKNLIAADLTHKALELTRERCRVYGTPAVICQQDAENLGFRDAVFSHANCPGVIHHTPNTDACVREIARILEANGTAIISVYYKNIFLRFWPFINWAGKLIYRLGGKLKGRGRESIFALDNTDDIIRLYDGQENPVGKGYSRNQFIEMLTPYFQIEEIFLQFFPARTLPFKIPRWLHKFLARNFGFLICASLRKL
ncbi:MAG: class I SAM-dependent methyltransferase [Nitrospina sp.]|nr:class I SAM-dependent methyltransferase [Nitrospina sp.]MBT4048847.1 class I SAM-dependent methyltransferase [Nitrospina sp.]MBT4390857.1 class I SAM-dependent methyltransferase [Nitrospina sp.]MBT4556908.1 class I SAM-dependent methyltransferase [Nitrospina sp.]MBT6741164.1 class I SAM-dependent methyltransferase [Nitrospina sp.]